MAAPARLIDMPTTTAMLALLMPCAGESESSDDLPPRASVALAYTADVLSNVAGGLRRGTTYLDNFDLIGDIDAERLWGIAGLTLHVHLLHNNDATDRFYAAGVVRHGALLPQRQDQLGFAVAAARSSHPYRELQARDGLATDDHEVNFELTWRARAAGRGCGRLGGPLISET